MKRIYLIFFLFVISTLLILQFGLGPALRHLISNQQREEITTYNRELSRGVFFILVSQLENIDQSRWADHLHDLQPHFSFTLSLQRLDSAQFTAEEKKQLGQGVIAVRGDGDLLFQRINTSPFVLQLGPFQDQEKLRSLRINALIWGSAVVFLGLLSLLWALPFWRRLKNVQSAAFAFGKGDFSVRARLPQHSALAPLAESFNDMADRIQQLIHSHRDLTRAVSHELRTPLTRIRFSLEMLGDNGSNENHRRYISSIAKDVDELEAMITELLSYARFEAQGIELNRQRLPLLSWLHETAACVEHEMGNLQFRLYANADEDNLMTDFDPGAMGRAVTNLLRSAIRYADQRVELSAEHKYGKIWIHVDDDGQGIPASEVERIFEPFTRLDESRNRDSGGFGLGLAIAGSVAKCHGGEASASTSPLGGARFSLWWPETP